MRPLRCLSIIFLLTAEGGSPSKINAQGLSLQDLEPQEALEEIFQRGYLTQADLIERGAAKSDAIWQWPNLLSPKIIRVCWENPKDVHAEYMRLVRIAADDNWSKNSKIIFSGWGKCESQSGGIHIVIRDDKPETRWMGRKLDKKRNGMILNFTFNNWSTACPEGDNSDWIYKIAVHEFGHAIGLTHEHNRHDTPQECTADGQGTDPDLILTTWDAESVMNYCYCGSGKLSKLDILSVQALYGEPT